MEETQPTQPTAEEYGLNDEMKEALDAVLATIVSLTKIAYAQGRRDELKHHVQEMALERLHALVGKNIH